MTKNPVKKQAKKAAKKSPAKKAPPEKAKGPHPLKVVAEAVAATKPDPEQAQREDAARRRDACNTEIMAALERYRCKLHPFFDQPEAVGMEPTGKLILSANVQVIPYA